MSVRKSFATAASGLLVASALVAGCSTPAQLTDARQILDEAVKSMDSMKSVHFELTSLGKVAIQFAEIEPTPTPIATPTPTPTATPTPTPTPTATPTATSSASSSTSAATSASPTAAASATPAATPTPTPSSTITPPATPVPSPTATPSPMVVTLDGAQAVGDIDLANKAAHVTGTLPSVPDLAGEVIVFKGYAYVRTPGQTKYSFMGDTELALNPADPAAPPITWIKKIVSIAADDTLNPTLLGDSEEPDGTAYHIQVQVNPALVKAGFVLQGEGVGNAKVDLWIRHGDYRLLRLEVHTSDSQAGPGVVRIVLTRHDSIDAITAPDPNLFEIPALQS